MNISDNIRNLWTEPPTFDDTRKYESNKILVNVYKGMMEINNYDSDNRVQIIPLRNVEFIERIRFYLTFHMNSGTSHTIYVGESTSNDSMGQKILTEFIKYSCL